MFYTKTCLLVLAFSALGFGWIDESQVSIRKRTTQISPNGTAEILPNCGNAGGHLVLRRRYFAFQVSLRYNGLPICSGSIIDNRHILTAAHCIVDEDGQLLPISRYLAIVGDLRTDVGSPTKVIRRLTHMFVHENYDPVTIINDVAVLRIENLTFNPNINSIALAETLPPDNSNCIVSGWGLTSLKPSPILHFARVQLLSLRDCLKAYGTYLLPGMICAGYYGRDSCPDDSGGPLVCYGFQVGIVSWGVKCEPTLFPGVYASVADYMEWINTQKKRSASNYVLAYNYMVVLNVIVTILWMNMSK